MWEAIAGVVGLVLAIIQWLRSRSKEQTALEKTHSEVSRRRGELEKMRGHLQRRELDKLEEDFNRIHDELTALRVRRKGDPAK